MITARFPRGLLAVTMAAAASIGCGGGGSEKSPVDIVETDVPAADVAAADVPAADTGLDAGPGEVDAGCECGNGACEAACGESLQTCPCDCKVCEDGLCSPCEGPLSAKTDCCGTCGDGLCMGFDCGENPATCAADCGAKCGSGTCDKGETPYACPEDCKWQICGNGVCEPSDGGFALCPDDCGPDCGDCTCGPSENWMQCPIDCGFCGDHVCSDCPLLLEGTDGACGKDCSTASCTPNASKFCCGTDVCWTDSCDNAGPIYEVCTVGCAEGACLPLLDSLELSFVDAGDDFSRPLASGTAVAYLVTGYSGTKNLSVQVTNDAVPVPNLALTLSVSGGNAALLAWEAGPFVTNENGVATVEVTVATQATASERIEVCVAEHPEAGCLEFDVFVTPDGHVPLAVAVSGYDGQHDPADAALVTASVFVHSDDFSATCATLLAPGAQFAPDATATSGGLFDALFFDAIPGLSSLEETAVTVLVEVAFGTPGMPDYGVARGCVDLGVMLTPGGPQRFLEVGIEDFAPPPPLAMTYVFPAGDGKDDMGKDLASALAPGFNLVVPDGGNVSILMQISGGDPASWTTLQVSLVRVGGREDLLNPSAAIVSPDASTGLVSVPLNVIGSGPGFSQFSATIGGKPEVQALLFNVFVSPTKEAPLAVGIQPYVGTGNATELRSFRIMAFPHVDGQTYPCADFASQYGYLTSPHEVALSSFSETAFFEGFPELTGGAADVTVLAIAEFGMPEGPLQGRAVRCVDQGVDVASGARRYIELNLADQAPTLPYSWRATHDLDMYQALPPTQKSGVDRLITFAVDPASQILTWYCWTPDSTGTLGGYCAQLFKNPGSPNPGELTAAGLGIRALLDANFAALRKSNCPYSDSSICNEVYYDPASLSLMLSKVRIESMLSFQGPPDSDGVFTSSGISSYWNAVRFPWSFGMPDGTGWTFVSDTFALWTSATTSTGGFLAQDGHLEIDAHPWGINLGALVWSFFDDVVVQRVFGGSSIEGMPYVLRTVQGGLGCGDATACCAAYGTAVMAIDQQLGGMSTVACNTLVLNAPAAMRAPLDTLDASDHGASLGTAEPCPFLDNDGDWTYDSLGSEVQPCRWNLQYTSDGNSLAPGMTFFATRY